ncbi:hypothetical protein Egran_05301 [Elaphomyces granulatus]|uniref:DUF7732 domain-containing protein n=1 Tax=Elaphomyces granulatus TaxID=519963 RepID=A0A232LS29_9EURO|nr:hypothetical protein Egran_05301 [Elaphomyces granulatus]
MGHNCREKRGKAALAEEAVEEAEEEEEAVVVAVVAVAFIATAAAAPARAAAPHTAIPTARVAAAATPITPTATATAEAEVMGGHKQGGYTRGGSGSSRPYGGGSYYAGGARVPYRAGTPSPKGITPFLLPLTALSFFSGLWLYRNVYAYPYPRPYRYWNPTIGQSQTLPVTCLCQQYSVCGCDNNGNDDSNFLSSVIGDDPKNSSVTTVAVVNGTKTIFINGTLVNGTTAPDPSISGAPTGKVLNLAGRYWGVMMLAVSAVCFL